MQCLSVLSCTAMADFMDEKVSDKAGVLFQEVISPASEISKQGFIKENIDRIMINSSAMEGNRLDEHTASMLINGNLEAGGGRFVDYLELLNHKKVYERIAELGDSEISPKDIISMHESLFFNLLNNFYGGPRRSMTSVEDFITDDASNVNSHLEKLAEILNRKALTASEAFSNSVDFHLEFVDKHPFEDGNGRTARALMNWYLLKHGIPPVLITADEKRDYFNALGPFHFCGYSGAFASFMLYAMARGAGISITELINSVNGPGAEDRLLKDYLIIFSSKMDQDILEKEIEGLYSSGDRESVLGAVWMAGYSKTHLEALAKAIKSDDAGIRSMAMLSMEKRAEGGAEGGISDLEDNAGAIKDIAINGQELERLLAISILGKMWVLDKNIVKSVLESNADLRATAQVFNALRYDSKNSESVAIMKDYMGKEELDISMNAYIALLNNTPVESSVEYLNSIAREQDEVKDEVIKWLSRFKKGNKGKKENMINIEAVARALTEAAKNDSRIRKLLLGHLSAIDEINPLYLDMFKAIDRDRNSEDTERAYAAYCIGRSRGYQYLNSETGLKVEKSNSSIMNMAVFLAFVKEKGGADGAIEVFDISKNSLRKIEASAIGSTPADGFGTNFLSMCMRNFGSWKGIAQVKDK